MQLLPSETKPVAADECTGINLYIDSGSSGVPLASHKPAEGRVLEARCEDESVCVAEPGDGHVLVRGKSPGQTMVVVKYEHPVTHERGEGRVKVTFTPLPQADALRPRVVGGVSTCPKAKQ